MEADTDATKLIGWEKKAKGSVQDKPEYNA
jgi:hypothetical protein